MPVTRSYSSELAAIEAHPGEPLVEHLWAVAEHAAATARALPGSGPIPRETLEKIAWIVGASHDLAKATPSFQRHLRGQKVDPRLSSHALTSALIGYLWARDALSGGEGSQPLRDFLPLAVYLTVRRHHGFLRDAYVEVSTDVADRELVERQWEELRGRTFDELLSLVGSPWSGAELGACIEEFWSSDETRRWRKLVRRLNHADDPRFYLTENLLFSLLIDADRLQTAMAGRPLTERVAVPSSLVDAYRRARGWGVASDGVASLRDQLYAEVSATVESLDLDRHFFSLTAPTGLGKTITIASWLLKLRERISREHGYLPRVIYCLPFLSIIDQNAAALREALDQPGSDVLVVHHHLGDSHYVAADNEFESDTSRLLIEGWHSELVVTTFVQLFATLVNARARPLARLSRLAGAIVALDEIQALPARYWHLFETLARELATHFETRFVLVTATQPALFTAERPCELIQHPAAYFTRVQRVTLVSEIGEPLGLEALAERICSLTDARPRLNLGVVVNTRRSAYQLRALLASKLEASHEIVFLSSLVAPVDRLDNVGRAKQAVEECRRENSSAKPLVLVSTQVIEAGVDLDLDEMFRDFAPLDCVVQAAGRCNRNNALAGGGTVHLVRLLDERGRGLAERVYDLVLLGATREIIGEQREFRESELAQLVEAYFRMLRDRISTSASTGVLEAVYSLRYHAEGSPGTRDVAISDFALIEEDQPAADVFLELDDMAAEAWRDFQEARRIADRRDRLRRYGEIRPRLVRYVISVPRALLSANAPFRDGDNYYVPRDQIPNYYDRSTGWKLDPKSHLMW